jgi:hypothetical protein
MQEEQEEQHVVEDYDHQDVLMTEEENKEEDENDSDDSFSLYPSKGRKRIAKKPQPPKKSKGTSIKKSPKTKRIKKRPSCQSAPVMESPSILTIKKVVVKPKKANVKELRVMPPP